ncbi:o-succinylbenzoate synthase [Halobacteriales archaeon QH_2_65_14]|nr:MAG: o-succinylbenzoate synthase [Halobacteriales archaeon QH_2_65_14]
MIEVEPFGVRLSSPLRTASGLIAERDGFLVGVELDETDGVGEATPLSGWTESHEECRDALDRAGRVGTNLDWGIALAKLDAPAARHGLSLALADAGARSVGDPLYRYLGGDTSVTSVPVNATLDADGSPDEVAREARKAVDEGFQCLKLKVGADGIEEDVERVRAVRDAVGPDVELRVDANGTWTPEQAKNALDALGALDVEYVEQPLPPGQLSAHADLRESGVDVDVAIDDSLAVYDVEDAIEADAADVLVLKPMILGGPDRAVEAARQCREAGIEPVVSTTIDAVVARTGAVHVAASIPDVRPCGLATADVLETDLGPDPAPVANGEMSVPQENGLGLPVRPL